MRDTKLSTLPQELFMVVRVAALVRGINAGLGVDVSAARIWEANGTVGLKRGLGFKMSIAYSLFFVSSR